MHSEITVIRNAQVVLENGIVWDGLIVIKNGRILQAGSREEITVPADAQCIDAGGAYVGPGFVDLHVHGGGGYSTCFAPKEAAQHFLRHGETSILATTDYHMDLDTLLDAIHTIKAATTRQDLTAETLGRSTIEQITALDKCLEGILIKHLGPDIEVVTSRVSAIKDMAEVGIFISWLDLRN